MTPTTITEPVTLGAQYRDAITGFEGTATSRSEYLFGCVRVCLEAGKDGNAVKSEWFDEQRLVTIAGETPAPTATSGGPRDAPPSRDAVR